MYRAQLIAVIVAFLYASDRAKSCGWTLEECVEKAKQIANQSAKET